MTTTTTTMMMGLCRDGTMAGVLLVWLFLFQLMIGTTESFGPMGTVRRGRIGVDLMRLQSTVKGFAKTTPSPEKARQSKAASLSLSETKAKLVDLLPKMTGQEEEFRMVEDYVNRLEELYVPSQTLDFLNLAMGGNWQLVRGYLHRDNHPNGNQRDK